MSSEVAVSLGAIKVDTRSLKPFKSSDEYLWAMKEDLAEWFNDMYETEIDAFNFFDKLEDGVLLCRHANNIIDRAEKLKVVRLTRFPGSPSRVRDLKSCVFRRFTYRQQVQPGSWLARDNVSHFIQFCHDLQINECLLFETDDLVLRKNEKSVILCLLEVARHGFHFGMATPVLVKMEIEIDSQLARRSSSSPASESGAESSASSGRSTPTGGLLLHHHQASRLLMLPPRPNSAAAIGSGSENGHRHAQQRQGSPPAQVVPSQSVKNGSSGGGHDETTLFPPNVQTITNDLRTLHERVVELLAECTCPTQFPMIRVREGQYRIGESKMLIFVRILRKHIMVRVGGGWDTLAHFLEKHDPCRCRFSHRDTVPGQLRMDRQGDHQMVKQIELKRIIAPVPAPKEPWK